MAKGHLGEHLEHLQKNKHTVLYREVHLVMEWFPPRVRRECHCSSHLRQTRGCMSSISSSLNAHSVVRCRTKACLTLRFIVCGREDDLSETQGSLAWLSGPYSSRKLPKLTRWEQRLVRDPLLEQGEASWQKGRRKQPGHRKERPGTWRSEKWGKVWKTVEKNPKT